MGTVYWITGLSGAGKTTIGKLFYNHLKGQYTEYAKQFPNDTNNVAKPCRMALDQQTLNRALGTLFPDRSSFEK